MTDTLMPKLASVFAEGYGAARLRADALSGLTVAIVALPLSMAIAIASGVTPDRGLYTAIVGGFLAAWQGGELTGRWVPPFWAEHFGENSGVGRAVVAFLGGTLMAFGARLAGGCTSGHGISGTLQLGVSSWISLICFFVGGAAVANLFYRL